MPVITVSRLTGSGGATIGRKIAERLGADYLNTQIMHEVARRLGISEASATAYSERAESFIERLARVLWIATPGLNPIGAPPTDVSFQSTTQASVEVTQQIIREAAQTGNVVIFGHGAQFILADLPGALHVRFVAPFPARVERVMQRENLKRPAAERWVQDEDHRRAESIRQFYHADWHDPDPFHLMLNTVLLGEEVCIRLVLDAVEQLAQSRAAAP